jgi:cytochrome c oxidase subunit III
MATTLQPPRSPVRFEKSTSQMDPAPSRTGVWLGLAAITMTFAALTSAMLVRQGTSDDWRPLTLPTILYLNMLILIGSSFSLERSRKKFANPGTGASATLTLLYVTLGLGLIFIAGQCLAWLQLGAQGLRLASAPSASFFYVFTGSHALHVLGGIGALMLVIQRRRKQRLRSSTLEAVSRYWHFMTILWVYLFCLLLQRT